MPSSNRDFAGTAGAERRKAKTPPPSIVINLRRSRLLLTGILLLCFRALGASFCRLHPLWSAVIDRSRQPGLRTLGLWFFFLETETVNLAIMIDGVNASVRYGGAAEVSPGGHCIRALVQGFARLSVERIEDGIMRILGRW